MPKITQKEYYQEIVDFAKERGKSDLLRCLDLDDQYFCTTQGLIRWKCKLSLEYFFKSLIKPGGEWSVGHSLMCEHIERTNICIAIEHADSVGRPVKNELRGVANKFDKKSMYLMFRGWFKTTVISVTHVIQELLINPNLRLLLVSGSLTTAESVLRQIKAVFMFNQEFRTLFPDYCPSAQKGGKIEWGTQQEVTLPNRMVHDVRESSIMASSTTTKLTGYHFHKIVFDDIVDQSNCTNEDQIASSMFFTQMMLNLFDRPADPFYTFIGTRYHHDDVYGKLQRQLADVDGNIPIFYFDPVDESIKERPKKVA